MDGLTIRALVRELDPALQRGRINKVYQPTELDLVLHTYTPQGNFRLIASANPGRPRLHITGLERENPQTPPAFCMLLRRRLEGARVLGVEQPGWERIIRLRCAVTDELGNPTELVLAVECMGKHSNLLLLEPRPDGSERIVDSLKRVPESVNRYREILPGRPYMAPPPQDKLDPLSDPNALAAALRERAGQQERLVADALFRQVDGLGPEMAAEAAHLAGIPEAVAARELPADAWADLARAVLRLAQRADHGPWQAARYRRGKGGDLVAPFPLEHLNAQGVPHASCLDLSACLDQVYGEQEEAQRLEGARQSLRARVAKELERNRRKLGLQEESLRQAADADDLRQVGELLTANLHAVRPGMTEITVDNYYDPQGGQRAIPLDPHRTPAENLQSYFRRYTRARNTLKAAGEQAERSRAEVAYLEQVMSTVEQAESRADLEEIRRELVGEGYMEGATNGGGRETHAGAGGRGGSGAARKKGRQAGGKADSGAGPGKGRPGDGSSPFRFTTTTGHLVLVGRNNRQNDWLTLRHADDNDLWFHTKEIPGSHVILKDPGEDPPEAAIREAAGLAAYYSKGRQSGQVPVDYTRRRHVRKPAGAKPGMVIYDHQRTLFVTPDPEQAERLRSEH
ncbi:MAG: NFACT family protein [Bacillota bacterium]